MTKEQKDQLLALISDYAYWMGRVAMTPNVQKSHLLSESRAETYNRILSFVENMSCDHGKDKMYTYIDEPTYVCECGTLMDLEARLIY